ncbi:hypothetical protein ATCC90586_000154 [Pythium insidiosum]|nr:hypothetical protein ATCC90586_000154 [Pythium insidiosum]
MNDYAKVNSFTYILPVWSLEELQDYNSLLDDRDKLAEDVLVSSCGVEYLRMLPLTDLLVAMMSEMVRDVVKFLLLYAVFQFGFSGAFFLLFQGSETRRYSSYGRAFMSTAFMLFGDFDAELFLLPRDDHALDTVVIANALLLLYLVGAVVMLLNLLIAMMSTTYEQVQESAKSARNRTRTDAMLRMESLLPLRQRIAAYDRLLVHRDERRYAAWQQQQRNEGDKKEVAGGDKKEVAGGTSEEVQPARHALQALSSDGKGAKVAPSMSPSDLSEAIPVERSNRSEVESSSDDPVLAGLPPGAQATAYLKTDNPNTALRLHYYTLTDGEFSLDDVVRKELIPADTSVDRLDWKKELQALQQSLAEKTKAQAELSFQLLIRQDQLIQRALGSVVSFADSTTRATSSTMVKTVLITGATRGIGLALAAQYNTMVKTVLITGATRGIGLALAAQYKSLGWRVIGGARRVDAAEKPHGVVQLDVQNEDSILYAAEELKGEPVDLLINNAGIVVRDSMGRATKEDMLRQFEVNAIGPFLVTRAFYSHLKLAANASGQATVGHISGIVASLGACNFPGLYGYSASKAALNVFHTKLARDLKKDKIVSLSLHPGIVATDLTANKGNLQPHEAAQALSTLLNGATAAQSGKFLDYQGKEIPW